MLLTLNEYCLHEVCNHLNLQDHLFLADVCEQLFAFVLHRFETAQKLLKKLERSGGCWLLYDTAPKNCPKLLWNLKYNSYGEISCDASKIFCMKAALDAMSFCNITSLKIYGQNMETTEQSDELEQFLTSLFPDLEKIQSSINFSGKYISKLNRLTELVIDIDSINEGFIDNLKAPQLTHLTFTKPVENWQHLAALGQLAQLEVLKLSEEDYRKLSALPDFKLPQSLTKLIVTAAIDDTELKFDENAACYAHIESVNFSIVITLEEFSYDSVQNIMTALRRWVYVNDDINTLKQLYKTHPKDWKQVERIFYFNELRDTTENCLLQEKMLEMVQPIFHDDDYLGLNPKQRVAIVLLSQARPKRFIVRCRNVLSELLELPYVPKYLEIRMIFKTQLKNDNTTQHAVEKSVKEVQ